MDSNQHHEIKEKIYGFINSHKKRIYNFDSLKRVALTEISKESWQEWEDYICRISEGELERLRHYITFDPIKSYTKSYVEFIEQYEEITSIGTLKKLAREFYTEETAKEFIKSFNRLYSRSEYARQCIYRAIQNNIKKRKDELKEVIPNEEWDAEAWHELGIPTDEDGDPICI